MVDIDTDVDVHVNIKLYPVGIITFIKTNRTTGILTRV